MGLWAWTGQNWFNLFSLIGIIGSLLYAAASLRADVRSRQISNLLAITSNHREIWRDFGRTPAFQRVLDPAVDLKAHPVTPSEEVFVNMVISHIASVHHAVQKDLLVDVEGLKWDISEFFALPIPNLIWDTIKKSQNRDFVDYVESCRK